MRLITFANITVLLLLHSCLFTQLCSAIDTITQTQFIQDHESITSNGSLFKLGFFSPNGSTNRYVGIWFNEASVLNVIWIANRDKPLNDSNGSVRISEDGNLLVLNGLNHTIWSTNVSSTTSINSSARILDTGNLVLTDGDNGGILWESFENPSDSFLPKMKLSSNKRTGEKTLLRSWTNPFDPSIGNFSAGLNPLDVPEFFIWNNNRPYWRSGPWNSQIFIGVPAMNSIYLDGFSIGSDGEDDDISYITLSFADESSLSSFVLDSQGVMKQLFWENSTNKWVLSWLSHESECDVYAKCGESGICNAQNRPICSCLRGFEPKNAKEWNMGNWTSGCVRTKQFQCERIKNGGEEQGRKDGFLKMKTMKAPDLLKWSSSLEEKCMTECFNNCSCVAYASYRGIGCMSWSGQLLDLQEFSYGGTDLYIRVPYSELDKKRDMKMLITISVIMGTLTIALCAYITWRWMARQRGRKVMISKEVLIHDSGDPYWKFTEGMDQEKLEELPVFAFATLATATNNFDIGSKLGQGGFGPVYKGKLVSGQEIAVKRLSTTSGQGLEEFMNEVVVISKLQHRNLVRLLGCCVGREEKMLVYEYMPNKSLDSFLFDPLKHELLDWKKRFEIIVGIGRGLLYLHRDSRLRIIHRDLKASNILLDEELNPKISDFGMARIFVTDQDQANTLRVVGTYGYMSPEYAMGGKFSEKSDVFSFGVLLLEIVIRRRNTGFYNDEQSTSLLGFVWTLWNEQKVHELLEQVTPIPSFRLEALRCIHVGLLCVQEFAKDRPNVSVVLSMLTSEILDLPTPKQPAFTAHQIGSCSKSSPNNPIRSSGNNVTVTLVEGR